MESVSKSKVLAAAVLAAWLVIGLALAPAVRDVMLSFGYFVRTSVWHIWGYAPFIMILAVLIAVLFVGRAAGVFDRFVAGFFFVFHSFPALAWLLEPALYVMVFPVGIFALLCSPLNPIYILPPARPLLETAVISGPHVPIVLWLLGMSMLLVGLVVFAAALVEFLKGKGLVKTGLYSVVRHPQYLGIILAAFGFMFYGSEVKLISLFSWVALVSAYVWLARKEEALLQEKYGKEFLAYK
jgi:protein-S-isoprenylcysteine O-methyltransferase Ste14